jgi:phosphate transport system substrate-binding protein
MSRKFQKLFVCHLLALLLMSVPITSTECVAQKVLTLGGTGAALGTMSRMADSFHELHPDIEVKIIPSLGSSGAIKAIAGNAIDIAFSSKPLKSEDRAAGLMELEYAKTPFVFVTRDSVGVTGVTTETVGLMFSGAITTWPNGQRIRLIIRPEAETDTRIAKSISSAMSSALDSLQNVPGIVIALSDQECSEAVGAAAGILAFTTFSHVLTSDQKYVVLSFNGVAPNVANLKNGSYPLCRSFYIVTNGQGREPAKMFLDFVRSPQGKKILEDAGNQSLVRTLAEN